MSRRIDLLRAGFLALFALAIFALILSTAEAHCDTMDGPVIKDARQALQNGDLTTALKWVKAENETELSDVFKQTLEVRRLGGAAQEMADKYFFETLVRLHRAGEGAPYTGLKPAGSDLPEAVLLSDRALEQKSDTALLSYINKLVVEGIHLRFLEALEKSKQIGESTAAGREYVEAYVTYVHFVERLYLDSQKNPSHASETEADNTGHAE